MVVLSVVSVSSGGGSAQGSLASPGFRAGGFSGDRGSLVQLFSSIRGSVVDVRTGWALRNNSEAVHGGIGHRIAAVILCCPVSEEKNRTGTLAASDEEVAAAAAGEATHGDEPHAEALDSRLNWLRAAVLGANDGVVSVAGITLGVAAATTERSPIVLAGVAGLVAGAVSMALGEYVSVSSQRDSQRSMLAKERRELAEEPEEELAELAAIYQAKGLSAPTAERVARELTDHDAFAAHVEAELGIDPEELSSPWHAAGASALAFVLGGVLPLLAILLPPPAWRIPVAFLAVLAALGIAGWISARLGGSPVGKAVLRVVAGGALGLAATYGIGHLVGIAVG